MKNTLLFSLIIASILISTDTALLAERYRNRGGDKKCYERGHRKGKFFGNPDVLKSELNLNDEQMTNLIEINLNYEKKHLVYREKLAPLRIKLKRMILEEDVDLSKIRQILKKTSELQVETRMLRIKQRLDIEKILTPAQKNKLRNSRRKIGLLHHEGRGFCNLKFNNNTPF